MAALFVVRDGPHGPDHWLQYAPADPAAAIRITVTNHKGTLLHVIDTKIE